jgi:hypothetical protein
MLIITNTNRVKRLSIGYVGCSKLVMWGKPTQSSNQQGSFDSVDELTKMEQDLNNQTARNQTIQQIAKTQKEGLIQWVDYLSQSQYNVSFKFLMLKAILNFNYDLKKNKLFQRGNDTIRNFTPFDAGSLAELENSKSDYLLFDYSVIMNENSIKALTSSLSMLSLIKGK